MKKTNILIYIHRNKNNHKVYIGQTIDISKRWKPASYKNCKLFYKAIEKYGWENFEHEILFETDNPKIADEKEIELIKLYDSTNPNKGYNIQLGGSVSNRGRVWSDEAKNKISNTLKGTRTGKENPMYGKHPSNIVNGHPNQKLHDAIVKRNKNFTGKKVYINNEYAGTVMELSKKMNISPRTIRDRCLKHYKGYSYEYI